MALNESAPSETLAQLQELQDQATQLDGMLEAAQVRQRVDGNDHSRGVTIGLAEDGLPEVVRVSADWLTRIGCAGLTAAVVDAARDASERRAVIWSQRLHELQRQADERAGLGTVPPAAVPSATVPSATVPSATAPSAIAPSAFDRLHLAAGGGTGQAPLPLTVMASTAPGSRLPRLDVLAEMAIQELHTVTQLAPSAFAPATGVGTDTGRNLSVTLSQAGLISCAAPENWLARQSGAALGSALTEAVAAARTDLARALAEPGPSARLDDILTDALAVLTSGRLDASDRVAVAAPDHT
jgi:hypothetical protein